MQIYATIGGIDNLRTARKHYCRSIELNPKSNIRAHLGLVSCTTAIANTRSTPRDIEESELNARVQKFAIDFLQEYYTTNATSELAEIGTRLLSSCVVEYEEGSLLCDQYSAGSDPVGVRRARKTSHRV